MPTNLKRESPYRQLVRGIQEELNKQWIHDGVKITDVARKSGLAYQTVKRNLNYQTRSPYTQTIIALGDALKVDMKLTRGKVEFSDTNGMKRKTITIKNKGKPILQLVGKREKAAAA